MISVVHYHAIPSCCIRPFSTSVHWTSKANLATYTHIPKTRAAQVHTMYTQLTHFFGAESSISSILTYLLLFFWFYLSSVVEVKGKRERLLFVKLLQSSLPLAITMSSSKALFTLSLLARALVVGSRPTVSRGAMNTDKTHT